MGARVSRTDFEWTTTDHPHILRRTEILKKHPEIKQLMGFDPMFKWVVTSLVLFQCACFWLFKDLGWLQLLVLSYCLGGVINHSLTLAIHDLSHNMAFGYAYPARNRWFGIFANLPIGVPMSVSFKKYHVDHHRYQGNEVFDTDVPTSLEARLFCTTYTKILWLILQPVFYVTRPVLLNPKPIERFEMWNIVVQILFNLCVYFFCGWPIICYMIGGTFITMGLHPIAGHFISEHYMFKKGFETYSYYGFLNVLTFNVGYHMEHHDFPNIPSSKLPQVRKIAPEYYDNLPHHTSWLTVLWDFVTDPEVGPYARVKRREQNEAIAAFNRKHFPSECTFYKTLTLSPFKMKYLRDLLRFKTAE